ncbi:hypothetical protein [Polaromonas sp.]|uniref:hypothetical protein n=1 Tax=Polaromonas sp. TaxID=1869339 RepID=UPI0025FD2C81|nr:hypothetical protein [Polaromonas sp.]
MARARNIKPGFFKNEILGVADPLYSLLFEGLWVLADRDGKLEDRPLRIKGEVFPYREGLDIDAMLDWLQAEGFIRRYKVGSKKYILVLEFVKHQNPHKNETESEIPDPEKIGTNTEIIGSTRADSLSSDSGFRIPDSLIPDSLIPDSLQSVAPPAEDAPAPVKLVKAQKIKEPSATAETWTAYAGAYVARYGTEPVRNASVNAKLSQFVGRVGAGEAPGIAAWFLNHRNSFYVQSGHSVGVLLRDCEKLRTEWATGRQVTQTQAIQADRTQTNANAFAGLLAEAKDSHAQH